MADQQKLVLMIQPTRLQGLIWQTVLRSQQINVIWETPETDLMQNISQLMHAGLTLPDLLLIDMRLQDFNPYAFCRWCRDTCPELKVILVNAVQKEIIPSERQWAMLQGAEDLLPGFDVENLMTSVTASMRRVLEALDDHPLDNGALVSVLLSIRRQIDSKRNTALTRVKPPAPPMNGRAVSTTPPSPTNGTIAPVPANGHTVTHSTTNGGTVVRKPVDASAKNGLATNGSAHSLTDVGEELLDGSLDPSEANGSPSGDNPPLRRRYRGRSY